MRLPRQLGSCADLLRQRQPIDIGHAGASSRSSAWADLRRRRATARPWPPFRRDRRGLICQSRNHCSMMWRFAALSSTTSTRRPWSRMAGESAAPRDGAPVVRKRARKVKVLPRPNSLSTEMLPPMSAAVGSRWSVPDQCAVFPRGRGILMLERPKDLGLLLARDANAGGRAR